MHTALSTDVLDILPNPVLVKNAKLEYVWINKAFEKLFNVKRDDVIGQLDRSLFPDRQVAQCSGGDTRVLDGGEIDEATETVYTDAGEARDMITRKSRLNLSENEVYLVGVMHDITEVTQTNAALNQAKLKLEDQAVKLSIAANTDFLTSCLNRRALDECEKTLLNVPDSASALMIFDLDHFKDLNDTHGHDCGDAVLVHFAKLVRTLLSDSDYFIRLGGEEFLVACRTTTHDDAVEMAESIRELVISTPLLFKGKSIRSSVSCGIAFKSSESKASIDTLLSRADKHLYCAKSAGRNQVSASVA